MRNGRPSSFGSSPTPERRERQCTRNDPTPSPDAPGRARTARDAHGPAAPPSADHITHSCMHGGGDELLDDDAARPRRGAADAVQFAPVITQRASSAPPRRRTRPVRRARGTARGGGDHPRATSPSPRWRTFPAGAPAIVASGPRTHGNCRVRRSGRQPAATVPTAPFPSINASGARPPARNPPKRRGHDHHRPSPPHIRR